MFTAVKSSGYEDTTLEVYAYYSEFSTLNNPAKIVCIAGGFNSDGKLFIKFTSNKAVRVQSQPLAIFF